jgi:hypothetical protein
MRRFWKLLLRKNLPPTILAGTKFAVFGLGDSGYVKYNVGAPGHQQQAHNSFSHLPAAAAGPGGSGVSSTVHVLRLVCMHLYCTHRWLLRSWTGALQP